MQREDSRAEFQKQRRYKEDGEIASRNMGAGKQYSSIISHDELIEGISKFFIANIHDFYTDVFGGERRRNEGY